MLPSPPSEDAPHRPPRLARPSPVPRLAGTVCVLPAPDDEDRFWAEVGRRGTPVVGPDPLGDPGYAAVTFLWRGTSATRAVQVMPNKLGDPSDPSANLMERVPGTNTWHWTLRLRRDWRGTYEFYVDEGGGPGTSTPEYWRWLRTRRRSDPSNPRALPGRWDGEPVSYAELPDAPRGTDWEPRPDVPRGTVTEHELASERLSGVRRVWLYEPPGGGRDLPVLVLLDGEHWQPRLGLSNLLDNLIADGRVPPVAAVLPESVDVTTRWNEMACRPEHAAFLAEELLPWAAAERISITNDPARTIVSGQSLGGLAAAHAALTYPQRFGNVLAQSGSFWWPDGPGAEWLTGVIAEVPRRPVRFRLAFGEHEWVLLPAARRLRDTLAAAGYTDTAYHEYNGGHDYLCWRTELTKGLTALLT
ncbi:enterochelin esterase [Actinomadura gamaensis]|uniref:Enterochelin esterase n=1 Tax=Actinomadura gamaensis TaxID=1763541 RepID=A0ABV9TXY7_9ACTN